MKEYKQIERALNGFMHDDTGPLARILVLAAKTGRVSYEEIEKLIDREDDIEEVLLLGYTWRILVPVRSPKSMEWGDRVLMCMPGEMYELPNVVRYLVKEAIRSGIWQPEKAVAGVAKEMGDPDWSQIPRLVEMLGECAKGTHISAVQINRVCRTLHLGGRVDSLIADLKGSGIISPTLSYLPVAGQRGTPVYELNPSLFPVL